MNALKENGLTENTLVFYIGDNGAPPKIHKADIPGSGPGWDGSLNDPLNGEKGMLSQGGMHTPFVVAWPSKIPGEQEYPHPISALDVAATAIAIAGIETQPRDLDGVNLIPFLTGKNQAAPHDALMWRWLAQSAIRAGHWKLLRGGDREYLFNLESDLAEKHNLASAHPEIASRLRQRLESWSAELDPPGLSTGTMSPSANDYFDFYLDGKPAPPMPTKFQTKTWAKDAASTRGWVARGGKLIVENESFGIETKNNDTKTRPFLVRNGIKLKGPVTARIRVKTTEPGSLSISWRTAQQKDFRPESRAAVKTTVSDEWTTYVLELPVEGEPVHIRLYLFPNNTLVKSLQLDSINGKEIRLW